MLLFCAKKYRNSKNRKIRFVYSHCKMYSVFTLPFMGLMINEINIWIGGRTRTFFGWTHPNMMGLDFYSRYGYYVSSKRKRKMV